MTRLFREVSGYDTGGPTDPIPQEVRDKIEAYASWQPYSDHYANAAEFGYSLALPRIKELEQENERLREALEKATGVIKQWHKADDVWDIYFNHAPEMKPIRQALAGKKEGEV